ncbi:cyclic GMP-AMP synthase [Bubalus kerabau]|uniref:cyclic GMP-AMP synthase n=1 Tax=Bubalus carabanensis TaxID=3119969 RepID=UPI000DBCB0F7|nr:cyclic GMP-AMP synthase isoform X1 [Bubalus bubalis]XP_055390774.1 cyclic GMP-AMP synthase [Bubalus carabanensis]
MAPPRRKATRKAPETASGVSAPCVEGGLSAEPSEPSTVPETARPGARRCGPAGVSGSRREKSRLDPREKPQVRARAARAEDQAEGPAAPTADAEPPAAPGHPLPKASARSRATASSARARRPQSGPPEGPGLGPRAPAPHLGPREEAPGAWKPRAVLEKLKLSRQEISVAAEVVNRLGDHLLRRLNSRESEFKGVDLLRAGSYYERVKISAPNEFDLMFKLEVPRIQLEEYCNSSAHYFVKFKRNPKGSPLDQFLEGGILSASKMLFKFRKIIKEEIKHIKDTDVIMERKKRGSPAVTLLIRKPREISVDVILALESKSSWPASTQKGLPISNWLGTKVKDNLKRQPFYLVAKHAKEGSLFQEETWRLSFSHIEKAILTNHGHTKTCCETEGVKCCRKECLKLMKYLLEQLKKKFGNQRGLDKFCSYHVKTAFLHVCTQNPHDSQWLYIDLELCFDNCVTYFLQCLKTEHLEHYFIPNVNLFSRDEIGKPSKEFLSKQIEYEKNNGFPVFDES